jgi:ribosomal protein S27E
MAEAITIACPECDKRITVPADAVGRKARCKGCEHVFVVQAPSGQKAATKPAAKAPAAARAADAKKKAPDAKAGPAKPAKSRADDEDEDGNPYGVTSLDTAPRCPDCANELESEDAVICLHCGYNTRTRTKHESRAVEDQTGMIWFWWLLPGIICAVVTLVLLTFDILYSVKIGAYVDKDADWFAFIGSAPFLIWVIWAPTIVVMVGCIAFAVKRLILNPRPPERERRKKPKME